MVHGDRGRGGRLVVSIGKFTGWADGRVDECVARGALDAGAASFLAAAVQARASILVAGAPGSGKTTLMSCCAAVVGTPSRL